MSTCPKRTDDLSVSDFAMSSVWEYLNWDDTQVTPVFELPVDSLENRIVGTQVQLRNGERRWAAFSRISLKNPRRTQQFLVAWFEKNGEWFDLARYFDVDYVRRGPQQLASFFELTVNEVFPIQYDISGIATGDSSVVQGSIRVHPEEILPEDERIALSLEEE